MPRLVLPAFLLAVAPVAAATAAPPAGSPYFCGESFTLFLLRGETVAPTTLRGGGYLWSNTHGQFVFREGAVPLPKGARAIKNDYGIRLHTLPRQGRWRGYVITVDDRAVKTMIVSTSFKGKWRDIDNILSRFNFSSKRPPECAAATESLR